MITLIRWELTITSDDVLVNLGKHISELEMKKTLVGWNLEQLEAAADLEEERDSDSDDNSSDASHPTPHVHYNAQEAYLVQ